MSTQKEGESLKRPILPLITALAVLLTACTAAPAPASSAPGESLSALSAAGESQTAEEAEAEAACTLCRIVSGTQEGDLLLAGQQSDGQIYQLDTAGLAIDWPDAEAALDGLQDGMLVEVTFDGELLDGYPARFSNPSGLTVLQPLDDLCALYLKVLEDLWQRDPALNGERYVGVDLSKTSLSPAEQEAVAWAFGQAHSLTPVQGSLEELAEEGYLTSVSADTEKPLWQWEDGCLFSIEEKPVEEGVYSLAPLAFDAAKWRGPLGAYFFLDCTSVQSALGQWGDYQVGSEAIS